MLPLSQQFPRNYLEVDSGVETDDKWVAVVYGGTTRYVSADMSQHP